MKIINRSDSSVVYSLEEFRTRKVFNIGEEKDIPEEEVNALYQTDGGQRLLKEYLLVDDENWVNQRWDAAIEYFWTAKDIENSLKFDSVELLAETLDYAPEGVKDLIKSIAWKMPLSDLNKIQVIREKLGFDVQVAVNLMNKPVIEAPARGKRLRERSVRSDQANSNL